MGQGDLSTGNVGSDILYGIEHPLQSLWDFGVNAATGLPSQYQIDQGAQQAHDAIIQAGGTEQQAQAAAQSYRDQVATGAAMFDQYSPYSNIVQRTVDTGLPSGLFPGITTASAWLLILGAAAIVVYLAMDSRR